MTLLTIYSVSGYFAFGPYFYRLSPWISYSLIVLFTIGAVWLWMIWRKEVVYDEENDELIVGSVKLKASELHDVRAKRMRVEFILKDGSVVSFKYPLEDVDLLAELVLKGVKR